MNLALTTTRQITIKEATKIARKAICARARCNPESFDIQRLIEDELAELGNGWTLAPKTYIDGLSCQFIGRLAQDIRAHAVQSV